MSSPASSLQGASLSMAELLRLPLDARREIAMQLLWSLPRDEVTGITERLSSMMQKDIVGLLPPELATQILARLEVADILNCGLVSRAWARASNDQGLWAGLSASHHPPIKPSSPSWTDITLHRQLMSIRPSTPMPDEMNPEIMEDPSFDLDDRDMPGAHPTGAALGTHSLAAAAGGVGTALGRGRFAGVRQAVWERTGLASLPIFTSSPVKQTTSKDASSHHTVEPPLLSHLPVPSVHPQANYKHLYLVHRLMNRRKRAEIDSSHTKPAPSIVDAISSIEAGGLPGHSEAIYALALVRHPMKFSINTSSCSDCFANTMTNDDTATTPGTKPRSMVVTGREWLLSGSRDKTLRLWQLDCPKPRVVKVFIGAHDGSVLSLFTTKIRYSPDTISQSGSPTKTSPLRSSAERSKEKVLAVSGGSDGKICVWDLEGDGTPVKEVRAHTNSVLCVKGDDQRIVSCSKDRTIKVLDLHTLETLLIIGERNPDRHRGAINAVFLHQDWVISASGDRSIKVWCVRTGDLVTSIEAAHPGGIASLDFEPNASPSPWQEEQDGRIVHGTIVSGSSDASVRFFTLVTLPAGSSEMPLVPPMQDLTFQEMLDTDDIIMAPAQPQLPFASDPPSGPVVRIEEGPTCWTECLCPSGFTKPDASRCMRCYSRGHTNLVRTVCLQDDVVVTGSYDATVKVWDRSDGRLLNDLTGARAGRVFAVAGDRTRVISTGLDCRINIWNFAQGLDTSFVEP